MNVFCALMTMTGRSGRTFLMRGNRSKALSSGSTTSVMIEVAVTLADPAPERGDVAGRAHFVTGARQRLIEHGPDRRIIIGNENVSRWHQ